MALDPTLIPSPRSVNANRYHYPVAVTARLQNSTRNRFINTDSGWQESSAKRKAKWNVEQVRRRLGPPPHTRPAGESRELLCIFTKPGRQSAP